jgi:hypothetical protein
LGFAWGHGAPADSGDVLARVERRQEELQRLVKQLSARECAPPTAATPVTVPVPADTGVRAQLARVVREEGGELRPQRVLDIVPEPPHPAEPSRESLVARDECLRLVDQAVNSHEWGDAQAARFQQLMEQLTDAQREEVLEQLVAVLNGGEVRVTTQGAPF